MRKNILIISTTILLISCSKNAEQIESAKQQLLKMPAYDNHFDKYKFDVVEIPDRDVYEMLADKHRKSADRFEDTPEIKLSELNKESKYLNLMDKAKRDKIFYRIHSYRIQGDTLDNLYIFLDDKNTYIDRIDK